METQYSVYQGLEIGADDYLQLRSRLRVQLAVNLDAKKIHRLTTGYETLFSISKTSTPRTWTDFKYEKSRFTLYYSLSPPALPFTTSLGYMNDLIGYQSPYSVHYLALDVVFENPFRLLKKDKSQY